MIQTGSGRINPPEWVEIAPSIIIISIQLVGSPTYFGGLTSFSQRKKRRKKNVNITNNIFFVCIFGSISLVIGDQSQEFS